MVEFAAVMAIIAAFILVLYAGTELIGYAERRLKQRESLIDPEKVVAARFARGEIDEAEYSRLLSVLRLGPPLELPD